MSEHPCVSEVRRQHITIEDWLGGRDRTVWDGFETALAPAFEMIAPEGTLVRRSELLTQFAVAYAAVPDIRIEIRNPVVLHADDHSATVRYEEWQATRVGSNQRISTALFHPDPHAPLGWAWCALHETWLPPT